MISEHFYPPEVTKFIHITWLLTARPIKNITEILTAGYLSLVKIIGHRPIITFEKAKDTQAVVDLSLIHI